MSCVLSAAMVEENLKIVLAGFQQQRIIGSTIATYLPARIAYTARIAMTRHVRGDYYVGHLTDQVTLSNNLLRAKRLCRITRLSKQQPDYTLIQKRAVQREEPRVKAKEGQDDLLKYS